jgi:alcohol dehydrogenase (cytochrome c)
VKKIGLCASLAALALSASLGVAYAADYTPVTDARLANPEPENWLMTRGNYSGWSYSPLEQINTSNIKGLVPVWTVATGVDSGHEAPPLVNNGVMFVATPYSQVMALDAATGEFLWRYKHKNPANFAALHNTSRGVALYGDKVYLPGLDATLTALDAKTGKKIWESKVDDYKQGYYLTMAPLVVKGKILVGVSGGEFGIRGYVAAFDAETGKEVWRSYSIPAPGEPGSETWQKADTWKTGGGAMWMTGNYDPKNNLVYWGVGNGSPWFGDQRPGDNLYTGSTLALDGDTGKIKGHFQYHQNESWDWDAMNAPMLVNFNKGGETQGLLTPQRNGYIYWLKRGDDGSIDYLDSEAFVPQNVFKSIDPKTATGKVAQFCPGLWGGKDWPFESYNPKLNMMFVPTNENHCNKFEGKVEERVPGQWWTGVAVPDLGYSIDTKPGFFGALQAYDVNTGKRLWRDLYANSLNWGSVLSTGGGLLFAGGTNDRMFRAYDAKSGEELWHIRTNSGIIAPPSSFEVNGVQYIGVESGWGIDAAFNQSLMADLVGWNPDVPQGGMVWVFAVQK